MNIDRSKEEHDVWVNHIFAAHNEADWGIFSLTQNDNAYKQRMRKINKSRENEKTSILTSYKWTGKPSDDWNRVDHFVKPKVVG